MFNSFHYPLLTQCVKRGLGGRGRGRRSRPLGPPQVSDPPPPPFGGGGGAPETI